MSAPERRTGEPAPAPPSAPRAAAPFRWTGAIAALTDDARWRLFRRAETTEPSVREGVDAILARVRRDGDAALQALTAEFDGVRPATLEVPAARTTEALDRLAPDLRAALARAARNIETFHHADPPRPYEVETEPGVRVGRRPDPLRRVGLYAPGGRAAYPSSVLMGAIPARAAGVAEVVLCSPPGPAGLPSDIVLAAAAIAGVDRVFAVGGAQAIAAMAFGTETIPRVERIVGPGNAYVAEAKLQIARVCGIDSPAGPSELLVIAAAGADPERVARELLAQAEHGPDSGVLAVALDPALAAAIDAALARLLPQEPRRELIAASLAGQGALLTASGVEEALEFAAAYAPEHLLLVGAAAEAALPDVRGAGTVFVGIATSVAFGDYLSGANHTLPTGGRARDASGLSTLDFVRWTTWQRVSPAAAGRLAPDVARLAGAEGLPAHAAAAASAAGAAGTEAADTTSRNGSFGPLDAAREPLDAARAPLARAAFERVPRYESAAVDGAGAACPIDLSDNTNRFGVPPAARRALRSTSAAGLSRYPSAYGDELKQALAASAGVASECIVTGCGSDDVLDATLRALGGPGARLAYADPTFSMVPVFARANGLEPCGVPWRPDGALDAAALVATGAHVVYVCSPNNPTGALVAAESIEAVLAGARGLVVVDQAYVEFAGGDALGLAARAATDGTLLVTRTLSKAYGLAGLRIGYGIAAPALVREIEKARGPFKISAPAERAAVAVLTEDAAWVEARVARAIRARERLRRELERLGFAPLPSAANFLLVPVADAGAHVAALARDGIAVRAFTALSGVGDALRITVGPPREMAALRDALARLAGRRP